MTDTTVSEKAGAAPNAVNEVRLVGRVSQQPEEKVLPSGDVMWSFRVVVARGPGRSRQKVDALECAAWTARSRRSVATWRPDDLVEVRGAVRRRFFGTAGGSQSRVEIEMSGGKLIRRAEIS